MNIFLIKRFKISLIFRSNILVLQNVSSLAQFLIGFNSVKCNKEKHNQEKRIFLKRVEIYFFLLLRRILECWNSKFCVFLHNRCIYDS